MEEREKAAVEAKNAPKEKTIDMSGNADAEQWKADKAADKAKQVVRRSAPPRPVWRAAVCFSCQRVHPGLQGLEATQGQIDGLFSQLPYKCYLEEVASVGFEVASVGD